MNILFLSKDYPPYLIGGVGVYIKEASRALSGMGHNVFVITGTQDQELEYEDGGVKVYTVKAKKLNMLNPLRDVLGGFLERLEYSWAVSKKIRELVRAYKIDIVESCEARAEGFWYFLFNRRPMLIVKLHTPESIVFKLDHMRRSLDYRFIEYLEYWWIRRADKIIGLTDAVTHLTCRYFGIKKNNFPKVVNPIDINKFKPGALCPDDGKKVLFAGRLEFRKGIHILIKAMPAVLKHFPDTKFILVGSDCGMKDYVINKSKRLGVFDNLELVSDIKREDMADFYNSASCIVVPSLWENHPYVCLEAMACGRPVVASSVGGIPEIINDGLTGILIPPGSFNALAGCIIDMLNNKELREKLGNNARQYIEREYALRPVMEQTIKIYTEALNGKQQT